MPSYFALLATVLMPCRQTLTALTHGELPPVNPTNAACRLLHQFTAQA